ncbi:MAG: hypothetical protein JRD89_19905 [Deltaproteobacteria bacterium]|nr:hypothetical protein [Deltaproteobacteria bacterium]
MKKADPSAERLRRRCERLAARLGKTDWVLVGTIRPRRIPSRRSGSKTLLGPYYQWTFKERGKTVTVNLSASQAKVYQKAIDEQRKAGKLLAEMRTLSRQFLEATTRGVKRRNPEPQ